MGKISTLMIFSILLQMLEQCAATKRTASTCQYLFVNVINHFQQPHHHFEKKNSFYNLQHSYTTEKTWVNSPLLKKIITNIFLAITRYSVLTFSDHLQQLIQHSLRKLSISWFSAYLCWCCSSMQQQTNKQTCNLW